MNAQNSSRTALSVAVMRAAHQLIDEDPKILDDPVILRLLEPQVLERIRRGPAAYQIPRLLGLRSRVVLRSRVTEDRLALAVSQGVRQYLILGAGLDTFAYRQPAWASQLKIFEVDQPASQQEKKQRLAAAGLATPANLEFVPVDFEQTSLAAGLAASSFDLTRPAFLSWLGVMVYLSADAIEAVFRFAASLRTGSQLVLTFAHPETDLEKMLGPASTASRAAAVDEPWLTRVEAEDLKAWLGRCGFSKVEFISPERMYADYLQGRADGLLPPKRSFIACAEV